MVNLKNGFRRRVNGPEAVDVEWKIYWTDGRQGFASWEKIVNDLVIRNYQGTICMHAEYSDQEAVEELMIRDLDLAKSLFMKASAKN